MGKKGWMAAGMIPMVAGLGTLLGSVLKPKSNKKQEGSGNTPWRVLTHQPFLLTLTSMEVLDKEEKYNKPVPRS